MNLYVAVLFGLCWAIAATFDLLARRATELIAVARKADRVAFSGLRLHLDGSFEHERLVGGAIVSGTVSVSEQAGMTLHALSVATIEPGEQVTSRLLRSIPVAALLDQLRQRWRLLQGRSLHYERAGLAADGSPLPVASASVEPHSPRSRLADRRKQGLLREVAIAYLGELGRPGVYDRVARRLRRHQLSTAQIKALVRAARDDQWLSAAEQQGRRGAAPGPRLLADERFSQKGHGSE